MLYCSANHYAIRNSYYTSLTLYNIIRNTNFLTTGFEFRMVRERERNLQIEFATNDMNYILM